MLNGKIIIKHCNYRFAVIIVRIWRMTKDRIRSGVWWQNGGFTGRWELDAKCRWSRHNTASTLSTFPGLNRTGAVCVGLWRKGQILSDPDCLRAGCKLDDLICPTAKGFVTLGGKKCLASVGTAVAFGGERGRLGFLGFVQTKGFLFHQISWRRNYLFIVQRVLNN